MLTIVTIGINIMYLPITIEYTFILYNMHSMLLPMYSYEYNKSNKVYEILELSFNNQYNLNYKYIFK